YIAQDEPTEFALMAYTSNSSGSDTEKKEAVYEEKITVLEFEVKDKGNAVTRLTNQLEQTLKEKEDLKAKLEQFETSSKNLNKLINSQLSTKDKTSLGYGDQLNESDSEVINSVFDSRSSDGDDNQTNDRFKKGNEYHAVPPPLTGNYIPPLADLSFAGLDDSVYRPTTNKTSASVSQVETSNTPPSNTSVEMPRVESVRPSGVIIEDWVSDDEDIFQSNDVQTTVKPSFKKIEFTKARNEPVKSDKQAVKPRMVTQSPKVDRKDWNGKMTQKLGLGFGFTKKACFVCGSYSHLIKDCDFHEKRMSKKSVLNDKGKGTGHREVRPIWNNTQRINHQNKFVPTAVLTRSGRIPVSTAKHTVKGNGVTAVKTLAGCVWRPKMTNINNGSKDNSGSWISKRGNPQQALKYKGMFDSGCSRHMTGNKALLTDYQDIDGGFVAFGGSTRGGKITGIGKIRTNKIDFEDVFFVKELKFNLFSVSQMCDKKNSILFTETECLVLSPDFKLIDESQVLLRVPRQNNMYSFDLKNVVPSGDLTCLFAKATIDESKLWHRRLGHVNFKTMNKLVKGNLVRGLPSKTFENDHTCVACQKGKQHKASCKTKLVSSISQPLQMLHMDLFGPTSVRSINHKTYCLVVTDDFSSYKSSDDKAKDDIVDDDPCKKTVQEPTKFEAQCDSQLLQEKITSASSTNNFNTVSTPVNTSSASSTFSPVGTSSGPSFVPFGRSFPIDVANLPHDPLIPELEDTAEIRSTGIFCNAYDDHDLETLNTPYANQSVGAKADFHNMEPSTVRILLKFKVLAFCNAYDDHDLETLNTPYADQSVGSEANFNNMEPSTIVSPIPTTRVHSIHPKAQIIEDLKSPVQTRGMTKKNSREHAMISYIQKQRRTNYKDFQNCLFACFLSQHEPTKISQALDDEICVEAMQEELLQFKIQKVWTLVDLPSHKKAIGTKWVYRNKKDERGIVVRNKSRLVAQGYKQEEGIDYDDVFAPIARVEAIRLFLAFASFMNFPVYQMDVKSAFLYGTIEEEVYVCQPLGFVDPEFPEKVYKVEKALYGLHQAPRAWYETLSTYLLDNGFHRGQIDKTLFIKRLKGDILLVQVYVDDIIFGSTKKSLCDEFEQIMHNRFQMSSMGELTFFLGLQVKQKEDGIFISQDKYVGEILKKFGFSSIRTASTPMETNKALTKDEDVQPKVSHLNAVKRIFKYLKGQPKLGLWYPKDSPLILEAFSDSDYAGASLDRKSTIGGKRGRDTKIPQSGGPPIKVGDEAVHKELGDRMERAATTASSLEVEQDSGSGPRTTTARTSANGEVEITATIDGQVKTIIEASLRRHLKLEDNGGVATLPNSEIFDQLALMGTPSTSQPPNTQPTPDAEENVPMPYESPLHNVHSLGRDEGSLSLFELTLIRRVKKLELIVKACKSSRRARVVESDDKQDLEDPSKQGRSLIEELDMDARISLVPPHAADEGRNDDTQIYDQPAEQLGVFSAAIALANAAKQRRSIETTQTYTRRRRSVKTGNGRVSTASRIVSTASELGSTAGVKAKDKGKAIMQEFEPPKKVKKRVQVQMSMDEELAKKVFEEEQAKAMVEQEQERINFEAALEL
ncbi:putative ribonuclease H-like domain-containing protein, partial [Tanacetum coccineum]